MRKPANSLLYLFITLIILSSVVILPVSVLTADSPTTRTSSDMTLQGKEFIRL